MRTTLLSLVSVILLFLTTLHAATFEASFTDENLWNGKAVPEEEVCSDYNFEAGNTPEITLKHIPKYARSVVLSFTDETFEGMKNGGHGVLSYSLDIGTTDTTIPSIAGETFDLPDEFTSVTAHRGVKYGKEEGAYLAPCSGGKGNTYSVKIEVLDDKNKILATTSLTLGKY